MGLIEIVLAGLYLNLTYPNETIDYVHRKIDYLQLAKEIQKENLVITTINNEKLSGFIIENHTIIGTGISFDILNIIQDKFKFNYTIKPPRYNVWGSDKDGVLDLLKNYEANLSAAFLPMLATYNSYISYSPNMDTGEWVALMKRPKESATGSGLLAPFTLPVWILILLSLFLVGPIIYFIIYIQSKLCNNNNSNDENRLTFSLSACIWFVYGALLKQGSTLNPITDSSRLLFATWWIFITILTAFYTANLTAFLTLSKFTLPINEAKQIGSKKYKWVTTKGNGLEDAITSNLSVKNILGLPNSYINESDEFIMREYIKKHNLMFIREKPIVDYELYRDYKEKIKEGIKEDKRCTFVITKFPVFVISRGFAYTKYFKYQSLFDKT